MLLAPEKLEFYVASTRQKRDLAEPPEGKVEVTPLLRFIRQLKDAQKETDTQFLEQFLLALVPVNGKKTTETYLYQLAGNERPNPTLRLAKALVEQSRVFAPRISARPLTYEDLLVGRIPTGRLSGRVAATRAS